MKYTTEIFIEKAKVVHKNQGYDYSKVNYINSKTKVTVICPRHGSFDATPLLHLQGQKCRDCGYEQRKMVFKLDNKKFIEKQKSIFYEIKIEKLIKYIFIFYKYT